jgi:hypothetical protein
MPLNGDPLFFALSPQSPNGWEVFGLSGVGDLGSVPEKALSPETQHQGELKSAGEVREIRWMTGLRSWPDGSFDVIVEPDVGEEYWDTYDLKYEIAKAFEVPSYKVKLCYASNSGGKIYLCFEVPAWWECE